MIGAPAAVAILVLLNGGCACFRGCHSAEDATELHERVFDDNWRLAEPRMRATARQLGATLLEAKPETLRYPRSCEERQPKVPTPDLRFAPDPNGTNYQPPARMSVTIGSVSSPLRTTTNVGALKVIA